MREKTTGVLWEFRHHWTHQETLRRFASICSKSRPKSSSAADKSISGSNIRGSAGCRESGTAGAADDGGPLVLMTHVSCVVDMLQAKQLTLAGHRACQR